MKANELMIGDWVMSQEGNTAVVSAIYTEQQIGVTCKYSRFFIDYVDQFKPIPLTAEILEKNGWKKEDVFGSLIKYRFTGPIDIETGGAMFRVTNNYFFCGGIHYVHELQHALRLCGIEKEITL